jgi:hypothetical protein
LDRSKSIASFIARDQIDRATEQGLQVPAQAGELEERDSRAEVHKNVNVALRPAVGQFE